MRSFATTLARNGYVAVTFDFAGHARNPAPLTGSITETEGATRALLGETVRIADFARPLGDGRLAAPRPATLLLPNTCQHCRHAACLQDCPTGAIGRDLDGEVFIRADACTGCGNCVRGCPWDNIAMAPRAISAPATASATASGAVSVPVSVPGAVPVPVPVPRTLAV